MKIFSPETKQKEVEELNDLRESMIAAGVQPGFEKIETERKHVDDFQVADERTLSVMKNLADVYGVKIEVINNPGEEYSQKFKFDLEPYKATLLAGEYYIHITSSKTDLSDFWSEVEKSLAV